MGNIGPRAALPVMEGKAVLFKEFAGVDAFPICLDTQDADEIIETCVRLAPTFGGINLEDISSPRCMAIEEELSGRLDIPVFHDDQHGTAIVVMAALQNALKLVEKKLPDLRIVISGAGAAGTAVAKLLRSAGAARIVLCDRGGAIVAGNAYPDNPVKQWLAENTNPDRLRGRLGDVIAGADVFIGVSAAEPARRRGPEEDGPAADRLRPGQPRSRDRSGPGHALRGGGGDRPVGLSEPDQQRALFSRLLSRDVGRSRLCGSWTP